MIITTLFFYILVIAISVLSFSVIGVTILKYFTYILPPCWISFLFGWKCWDKVEQYKTYIIAMFAPLFIMLITKIPIPPFSISKTFLEGFGISTTFMEIIVLIVIGLIGSFIISYFNEQAKKKRDDEIAQGLPPSSETLFERYSIEFTGLAMIIAIIVYYLLSNKNPNYQEDYQNYYDQNYYSGHY
jgi:hypothetical protein